MKLSALINRLQESYIENEDMEIEDIFRNDFGDELVLEGQQPNYVRRYIQWDF